jgi:hypothetical protein
VVGAVQDLVLLVQGAPEIPPRHLHLKEITVVMDLQQTGAEAEAEALEQQVLPLLQA